VGVAVELLLLRVAAAAAAAAPQQHKVSSEATMATATFYRQLMSLFIDGTDSTAGTTIYDIFIKGGSR